MGVPSCNVKYPPAPIDTIWLGENGGANGVTELLLVGVPSAAFAFVKLDAKPVPRSYAITVVANWAEPIRGRTNTPASASANTFLFMVLIFQFVRRLNLGGRFWFERPERGLKAAAARRSRPARSGAGAKLPLQNKNLQTPQNRRMKAF